MASELIILNVIGSEASADPTRVRVLVNIVMSPPAPIGSGYFTGGDPLLDLPASLTESEMKAAIEQGAIDWCNGQTAPNDFNASNLRRVN